MEEYKPNSHRSKEVGRWNEQKKPVEKVIAGVATSKKKGEVRKFTDVIFAEDVRNVKSYILGDVLVPAIKKAISDIVTNGIDMVLYGESGRGKNSSTSSKISYRSYYEKENDRRKSDRSNNSHRGFDYDDIIFETRGDAESVLDAMNEIISQYGVVSVADLFDLANVSTDNYSSNKYGWTDIRGCKPVRIREGYILRLPKASSIN